VLLLASTAAARGTAFDSRHATVALAQATPGGEILAEIRVHGNYTTPDPEVVRLAGLALGQPLAPSTIDEARARLERSGRFLAVEIRKRYRSLDADSDVALIIIVQEYPVPDVTASPLGPLRRTLGSAMFLPILNFTDGYGFTYGGRVSFVDGFGKDGRLSVPLTWGGSKRAAAEFEKAIAKGPIDRVTAALSISRRTNPFYQLDDDRREATAGIGRQIAPFVRAGAHGGLTTVSFGQIDNRFTSYGADITLDTRADPVFPRNAVFAAAGWDHLDFRTGGPINRIRIDARGYVGFIGQSVVSLRAQLASADRLLPPYERFLLGGAETLRGYRAGSFAGDRLAAASVELRMPISSPLSFGRAGVDLFADVGTVVDRGTALQAARFHSGFGGGVFLLISIFQINADLGVRPGGGMRLHVMSGFRF
jgi:outer membrane protein assembly factor BamA